MERKIFLSGTAIVAAAAAAVGTAFVSSAGNGDSQTFHLERFALIAAEADAVVPPNSGNVKTPKRNVVLRIDTVTGKTDILQFSVAGIDDPTITNASWAGVSNNSCAFGNNNGF